MYDQCYIISQNVSLLQKNIEAMLSIVYSNSKGSIVSFSIGKKIKTHVQIGVPIGSEKKKLTTFSPSPLPPLAMYGEAVRLAKTPKSVGSILPALFSRQITPSSQGVVTPKNLPSQSSRHRRARVAGKAPTHQSPSCAPSLPPATRSSLGTSKPLPSSLGTGSR
jgi:hypothetical protein